jgi:hypothetical protein
MAYSLLKKATSVGVRCGHFLLGGGIFDVSLLKRVYFR